MSIFLPDINVMVKDNPNITDYCIYVLMADCLEWKSISRQISPFRYASVEMTTVRYKTVNVTPPLRHCEPKGGPVMGSEAIFYAT
ncbi:hypothetical protein DRW42_25035 [Pedobacter miscanthi]|uniref:Uncharacterized protein n=1 Tax=Pedobacter miscanthi TaxID=2259170 RepID=A0A366KPT0_9SPHI|nr:hypothetical protein DRW42_25035 [Pedobacter miscanthi]